MKHFNNVIQLKPKISPKTDDKIKLEVIQFKLKQLKTAVAIYEKIVANRQQRS